MTAVTIIRGAAWHRAVSFAATTMAYVGFVPSEYSSSERTRRGGITKRAIAMRGGSDGKSRGTTVIHRAWAPASRNAAKDSPGGPGHRGQGTATAVSPPSSLIARGKTTTRAVVAAARELTVSFGQPCCTSTRSPRLRYQQDPSEQSIARLNRRMPTGTNRKARELACAGP